MAFGAELKDFVSGFKTGYDMIDSPDDVAYKKQRRKWAEEDRDIAKDNRDYARGRDKLSDERWDYNRAHTEQREGKSDAQWDADHLDKVRENNLREEQLRQQKSDAERKATDGAPDVPIAPDPNDGSSSAPATPTTPAPDSSSGHGTGNQSYNAAGPAPDTQLASYSPGVDKTTTGSVTPAAYTSGDPTASLTGPGIASQMVKDLQRDYGMPRHIAIGITGALAGETGGFTQMQERDPTVPGSRGGYGYAQWTGPRRRQFEAYAGGDNDSYGANYGYLRHELDNTREGAVLDKLRGARDASEAQRIFTDTFLRPGTPNYEGRDQWTARVGSLFDDAPGTRHLARGGLIEADDPGMGLDDEMNVGIPDSQSAPAIETADASNSTPPPAPTGAIPDGDVPIPTPRPDYGGTDTGDDKEEEKAIDDRYHTAEQLKHLDPKNPYDAGKIAVLKGLQASMKDMDATAIDDPETQRVHEAYIRGYGAAPAQIMKQVMDKIDPEHKMEPGERNMRAMGTVYQYYLNKGDPAQAAEAAKSMLQYYRRQSQQFLALGKAAAQDGNMDAATKAAIAAYTNIPNGRDLKVTKNDDGTLTINVTNAETGSVVTRKVMKPEDFAAAAMQMHPGSFDDEILNAAGTPADKYTVLDPENKSKVDTDVGGKIDDLLAKEPSASQLDPKHVTGIKSIASGIAGYKENGIGADDAAQMAMRMVSSNSDQPASADGKGKPKGINDDSNLPFTYKPLRGDPDNTVVSMDGQKFVMPTNQFNRVMSLRKSLVDSKAAYDKDQKENNWLTGEKTGILSDKNMENVGKLGDELHKWITGWAGSVPEKTAAPGAIPDATIDASKRLSGDDTSDGASGGAIPESGPSTPSADSRNVIETLLSQRQVMVNHKDDPRAQRMIQSIDARLQQLGYKQ